MTTTLDCPSCGYGFVRRMAGRCPRCSVRLVLPGDLFDPSEHPWVWSAEGWVRR